jgi:hypothetical protein
LIFKRNFIDSLVFLEEKKRNEWCVTRSFLFRLSLRKRNRKKKGECTGSIMCALNLHRVSQ